MVTGGGQSGEAVTSGEHCCGRDAQKCRGTGDWALLFCLTPSSGIEARTDGRSPGLQVSATRPFPRALPTCVLSPLTSLLNAQALQNGKKMFNVLLGDDENGCCPGQLFAQMLPPRPGGQSTWQVPTIPAPPYTSPVACAHHVACMCLRVPREEMRGLGGWIAKRRVAIEC